MSRVWFQLGIAILCLSWLQTVGKSDSDPRPAQVSTQKQIQKQISELILKLDSNQRKIRQQAEVQLVKLGKPVLSLLPPPELISSNSVKEALQSVRLQIEKRAAKESIKASHVNLKGTFSLNQILIAITHQTGNPLDSKNLPESVLKTRIDVNYVEVPFWKTIDDLSQKLTLTYQVSGSKGVLQLQQETEKRSVSITDKSKVCFQGPFRIEIVNIQRRPLIGSSNRELLRATFLIQVEPRLRPLFLSYAADKIKATGDSHLNLPAFNRYAKYEIPLGEGGQDLKITMQWIRDSQQRIKTIQIQGRLKMELAAETLPITFDDLFQSQGAIRRRGNITVELVKAEKKELDSTQNLNIRISLSYDYGGPAFESHRTWIYHNRAYLQNPQGKKYWLNGSSQTTLESAGKISVLYQFTDLPLKQDRYQLTYLAPTLITAAPIEFRFEKIAFPAEVTENN
ncbi:MAG: hypothetical protein K0U86_21495 [Planctomycetes bacterium]|nr:hypothetical protein [Planctomycetota bacterium]MCH9727481.1 hypothetical protein [Planctomycetota bacterium]MCH9775986.1 hypothetical protein [Planctomycetota bacterium]